MLLAFPSLHLQTLKKLWKTKEQETGLNPSNETDTAKLLKGNTTLEFLVPSLI